VRVQAFESSPIARRSDVGAAIVDGAMAVVRGIGCDAQLIVVGEQPLIAHHTASRLETVDALYQVRTREVERSGEWMAGIISGGLVCGGWETEYAARTYTGHRAWGAPDLAFHDRAIARGIGGVRRVASGDTLVV